MATSSHQLDIKFIFV